LGKAARCCDLGGRESEAGRAQEDRERVTFHVPVEIADRVRAAVYWTPGLTMGSLAAQALEEFVEKKRGAKFQPAVGEPKGGRPVKIRNTGSGPDDVPILNTTQEGRTTGIVGLQSKLSKLE